MTVRAECLAQQGVSKDGRSPQLQPFVLSLSKHECSEKPTPSGVARQLVTFFCFAKKKVTKEKATPARRPFGVPCVARLARLPHKLARSATRPRAQTYSSEFPDPPPLLGGGTGERKAKTQNQKHSQTRRWAQSAHLLTKRQCGHECPHKTAVEFLSPVRRLDISPTSGDLGALSELRSGARCVCPARASCAAPLVGEISREPEGRQTGGDFFWLLFLARQEK